jgi:hypothetical protein
MRDMDETQRLKRGQVNREVNNIYVGVSRPGGP